MNTRNRFHILSVALMSISLLGIGCLVGSDDGSGAAPGTEEANLIDPLFEATAGAKKVAVGDIDGDGLEDLVSISDESQRVQIHLYNGSNAEFNTYTIAGGAPLSRLNDVEIVDMNGDGKLDIVVLINDTGFEPAGEATKASSFALLIQGDDPTDPNDWSQMPAAGRSTPANITFGGNDTGAADMVVGELDGENGPDIAILSNESDFARVRLFPNPGPALVLQQEVWQSQTIELDASDMSAAALSDLDADGDLDIVMSVPMAKSFNIRWLQNPLVESNAQEDTVPTFFQDQVDPLFEASAGAKAVVLGDINGDGIEDAVSIHEESQPVQIHLRDPDTGYFETTSIAGGGPLARMNDVDLADLNADGKLDIVVLVNDTGFMPPKPDRRCGTGTLSPDRQGALSFLIQGDDPTDPSDWTQVDAWLVSTNETGLTDMVVDDFDNDSLPDIAVLSNEPFEEDCVNTFAYLFLNPGVANAADANQWDGTAIEADVNDLSRIESADLDRDGDSDLVLSAPTAKTFNIRWLRNRNNGATWDSEFLGQQDLGGDFLKIGDIDGDGNLDVAAASVNDALIQWFRNPGPTALAVGATQVPFNVFTIGTTGGEINQLQLTDLNGDGDLDAFVTMLNGRIAGFLQEDDPEQQWSNFTILDLVEDVEIGRSGFTDFDGDGKIDFVAPINRDGLTSDEIGVFLSTSGSRWERRFIAQQEGGANYLAVGDIDGDGLDDVIAAHSTESLTQWFRNPGQARLACNAQQVPWEVFTMFQFSEETQVNEGNGGAPELNQVAVADINNDGDLEVFVTGSGTAYRLDRQDDAPEAIWSAVPVFTTDPVAEIGEVGFLDLSGDGILDYITPINREGLSGDMLVFFPGN
jgi:hypothetical protein